MSVFDQLPKRPDGTTITPWDPEWAKVTNVGRVHRRDDEHLILYEPRWSKVHEPVKRVWNFKPPEQTGELVDSGLTRMLQEDGYKKHFAELYAEIDKKYGIFTGVDDV